MTIRNVEEIVIAGHHWNVLRLVLEEIVGRNFTVLCAEDVYDDLDCLLPVGRGGEDDHASNCQLMLIETL